MLFSKEELKRETGAQVLLDKGSYANYEISTDSRTIKPGDMYLPLKGETFDGETFVESALHNGARAYFTARNYVYPSTDFVLKVKDTKEAYLSIAEYCRDKIDPKTIAVTGSAGKTTTKEMIYSVLSKEFRTHKTFSNHNNEIGFCQTVLSMPEDTEVLIVEMGMRGFGEIELISNHLKPDYAVITNSGSAHVGRLGSLDNIASAKCEITSGLRADGVFISKDQEIIKKHLNFEGEKIFYSLDNVQIIEMAHGYSKFKYKDNVYELNAAGDYNIENSLAAIELGLKMGMSVELIQAGLLSYRPIEKRWEAEQVGDLKFINDSYNANPDSMKVSVKTFFDLYDKPVVVLGDMGELGDDEVLYHKQVGEYIAKISPKDVKYITVGKLAAEIANVLEGSGFEAHKFDSNEQAACYILENLRAGYTIFLKASRAMKFEEILEKVKRGIV